MSALITTWISNMLITSATFSPYAKVGAVYANDDALYAVSPNLALTSGELGLGYAPESDIGEIELQMGLGFLGSEVWNFQTIKTELHGIGLNASALYAYRPLSFVRLFGRFGVGIDRLSLELDRVSNVPLLGHAVVFGGDAAAGLELLLPIFAWEFSVGLEGGYRVRTTASFDDVHRDASSDTEPARISIAKNELGEFNLSGATLRLSFALRF